MNRVHRYLKVCDGMVDYTIHREHKVRGHKGKGIKRQSYNVSWSNCWGLKDIESGPYVIKKKNDTTIEVKTGTFKDGSDRVELHSRNNAKPAVMAEDAVVASRPKLGRPSKPDAQTQLTSHTLNAKSNDDVTAQPVAKKSKLPLPSTHTMQLRNRK